VVRHLRALLRLAAIGAWTTSLLALRVLALPLLLLTGDLFPRVHFRLMQTWARGVARLLGMRFEVEGRPPKPPYLLVSNHLSYVDVVALQAVCGCVFLAKAEVARWPVIGFLARTGGTLFVDRTRRTDLPRAVEAVASVVERGRGVVFFPEGTSTDGSSVLPFNPSLFEVAIRTGLPVYCASLGYAVPRGSPPAHLSVCWWGDMEFFSHLYNLLQIPSFRARIAFAPQPVAREERADRKVLAERARRSVEACFTPVVTPSS
jgi:1-acyl-sn-glycerol-3-phosphate acyltransferase